MLESLIITLREGIEAALVVGIIVSFVRREERPGQLNAIWVGLATAVAASFAGAWWLRSWAVNEEAFEGILYLSSAVIVASMMIWMWRNAHKLSRNMETSLERITRHEHPGLVFGGLFLFTFLMVFREGVETVLFLSAVSLTTSGLLTFLGAAIGLALAVCFAVLFIRGSLEIDLGRFLKITGIALGIFVLQLLVNGYHELAEAYWLPATPGSMRIVGPLVAYDFFFVVAIVSLPLLALAMPGRGDRAAGSGDNPAEDRLSRYRQKRRRRARVLGGVLGIGILCILGYGFAYSAEPESLSPATPLAMTDGEVRIPLVDLADEGLHRYSAVVDGRSVRFIALQIEPGRVVTGFDACVICGADGYYQQGTEIICMNCSSAIYPPSIGRPGGCNPIPLSSNLEGDELVIEAEALRSGLEAFTGSSSHHHAS
ncbi:MAG: Fe-S-containing protein [Thermoanaerobaculia bacterium]|nr:Fe-S-containing protein [Thermoanaerobaculia bacterium]